MKIVDVQAYPLRVPFRTGDLPAPVIDSVTQVIVKVSTDEGIVGFGEAFGFAGAPIIAKAVELALKPMIIGKDPRQIQKLWEDMYRMTYYYGRMGIMLAAISGVEIALWDVAGKARNIPVYQMLGGRAHEKLRAYASLLRYPNPRDVAQSCAILVNKGYTAIKPHEIDVAAVAAAREATGDAVDIMLDVNCLWDVPTAIKMGRQFKPFNLYWYEEPIWPADDYAGMAEVRAALNTPLAAGENEYTARGFKDLIATRVVDFIQPSVFKVGGILQEKKVFTMADNFGIKVAPHCWSWGPALAATLHISFSEPSCEFIETSVDTPDTNLLAEPLAPQKGFWKLSEKSGLGVELNEDVLTKYLIRDDKFEVPFWLR